AVRREMMEAKAKEEEEHVRKVAARRAELEKETNEMEKQLQELREQRREASVALLRKQLEARELGKRPDESAESVEKPVATVVSRKDQLALSSLKKSKPPNAIDEEDVPCGKGRGKKKAKAKSHGKPKGKASGSKSSKPAKRDDDDGGEDDLPREEAHDQEEWQEWADEAEAVKPEPRKKPCRGISRKRSICKSGKATKRPRREAKAANFSTETAEDKAVDAEEEDAEPPATRIRAKSKASKGKDAANEKAEGGEDNLTFARRYYPTRPFFQKKWEAIKNAYNERIKWAVVGHSKLEDCFWRYVHTKMDERGQTITDPEEWPEMANNLAWEYLRDDAHPELLG
ncbi:unnamed protein product, partial [Symbiodinium pilosum]